MKAFINSEIACEVLIRNIVQEDQILVDPTAAVNSKEPEISDISHQFII